MDPVQPVSTSYTGAAAPVQSQSGALSPGAGVVAGGEIAQAGIQTSSAVSITSSSTSISMVYSQVDMMLGNVGIDLQDNQVLRMIIALMILEALLAQDGGNQQAGGVGLLAGIGQQSSSMASFLSIQSETNVVQIQQQSSALSSGQAIQSIGLGAGESDTNGSRLDTSG